MYVLIAIFRLDPHVAGTAATD